MPREMGRYQLVRPLARGGMAEVFLARRRAGGLEKLLVIKRIRPERANDARFLELFLREARLSMSLTHQNIVPVFDFGRTGDQVFLAMERVEGKDLGSTLARPGAPRLPPVVAAFIAGECCRALAYAHERRGAGGEPLGICGSAVIDFIAEGRKGGWINACGRFDVARLKRSGRYESVEIGGRTSHACVLADATADGARRSIVVSEADVAEILQAKAALAAAVRRVVVKRPKGAPVLAGRAPAHCIESPNTRYDVYVLAGR